MDNGRRSILASACLSLTAITIPASPAEASEVRAPTELLRPATRVKLYIDDVFELCQSIKTESDQTAALESLKKVFDKELATFMTPEEEKLSKMYMEIDSSTAWQKARLKELEAMGAERGVDYTTPYDRFNTAVQQMGDKRQFKILRKRQRGLDNLNPMRAALNAYTNNLVFGDAYLLNAQGEKKKSMVRNDSLPNVNAVVVADLDLRDLIRNQVLQNMDDAKAELDYQLQNPNEIDLEEIFKYLKEAKSSCQAWFSFIPKEDVEAALRFISEEQH